MNTYMAKAADVQRKWYVVDAEGVVLGRLASQVAAILRGKNKPVYTPHVDTGDYVIILNADKVVLTGKKLDQKVYYHHSGYFLPSPDGRKARVRREARDHWYAAQGTSGPQDGEETESLYRNRA